MIICGGELQTFDPNKSFDSLNEVAKPAKYIGFDDAQSTLRNVYKACPIKPGKVICLTRSE